MKKSVFIVFLIIVICSTLALAQESAVENIDVHIGALLGQSTKKSISLNINPPLNGETMDVNFEPGDEIKDIVSIVKEADDEFTIYVRPKNITNLQDITGKIGVEVQDKDEVSKFELNLNVVPTEQLGLSVELSAGMILIGAMLLVLILTFVQYLRTKRKLQDKKDRMVRYASYLKNKLVK